MKSYKEVISERYDGVEKDIHPYENIYSILNPIGFYADKKIRHAFYKAFTFIRNRGADITQLNILDIGCGKGATTRFFSELTGNPRSVFGMDLSENRIASAIKMNSQINYVVGDIIYPPSFPVKFDVITALDIFMHLSSKEELRSALNNVKQQLSGEGYFIWYDAYSSDHFKTTPTQDHSGFHPRQMDELAREAGFVKVFQLNIFKTLLWRYHSLYLIKRIPQSLVNSIEKLMPGSPGNMLMVFVKSA